MKSKVVILVLAIILGVGIGWLIKPGPETSASTEATKGKIPTREVAQPAVTASSNNDSRDEESAPAPKVQTQTMVFGNGKELTAAEKAMQDQISKAMTDRQEKVDERKIKALIEKLGLDGDQEAALRGYFSDQRNNIAGLFSGKSSSASSMSNLSETKLDDLMAEVLSDEQKETYEEVKVAEREKKVESRALKDLAKLNGIIDLRPEQKDAVYEVLYEDAGSKVDKAAESGISAFGSLMSGGMGVSMDLDMTEMHGALVGDDGAGGGKPSAEAFKQAQEKRIDDRVGRLSEVLDEGQLQNYRESLESQGSVFGSFVSPSIAE